MRSKITPITRVTVQLTLEPAETENLRDALNTALERLNSAVPGVDAAKRSSYALAIKTLMPLVDELSKAIDAAAEAVEEYADPS